MENPADREASSGASSNGAAFSVKQRSADLHIRELAGNAGWHISPADPDPRREPFALIPPLAPMRLAEKTQVFPIRKNTHGDPQTLQNKHWRTSAKGPTPTVQARNASLLEPRKTVGGGAARRFYGAHAVARYFILRRKRETAQRNISCGATTMPFSTTPRLGFVGAGRLARCLAAIWSRAGYPVTAIASRSAASAREFAGELPGCQIADDGSAVARHADIVFLTVPDDAIGATANALQLDQARASSQAVVHCSGATPVDVLAPAQAQGAEIGGFHPLFLFGGLASDQTRIAGCSVTIEARGPLHDTLTALVRALGCHPLSIPPGGRLLPEQATVLSSRPMNFPRAIF